MTTSGSPASGIDAGFAIEFHGLQVELVLPVLGPDAVPLSATSILTALRTSPLKSVDRAAVEDALAEQTTATAPVRAVVGQVSVATGTDPPCIIVLSSDKLAAYAIPVPMPLETATDKAGETSEAASTPSSTPPTFVTDNRLRDLLNGAGVASGRLDEVIATFAGGKPLTDIVCVARGTKMTPGVDATLEYHFDEHADAAPALREDGSVDHHAAVARRFVAEGALLVTRQAPQPGTAGVDLSGKVTEPPRTNDRPLELIAGKNTDIDGEALIATAPGRPVRTPAGIIDVLPVFEVAGDVDYSVGNIDFPGDVVVGGDVKSGFTIVARNSVIVRGLVESASITAGTDMTVTGVVGEHKTFLKVGGNLTASYLHTTEAHVTGNIEVGGEIMNCSLVAEVVRTGARGRIVGGQVTAQVEVDSGTLGSREGLATRIHVASQEPAATIRARHSVHPGVLVQVGAARREISDEMQSASFWNVEGAMVSLRADIDAMEAVAINTPDETDAEEPPAAA